MHLTPPVCSCRCCSGMRGHPSRDAKDCVPLQHRATSAWFSIVIKGHSIEFALLMTISGQGNVEVLCCRQRLNRWFRKRIGWALA
eukprot:10141739-Karenia_brevis.AAC.1